jgi:hypothetical protein
LRFLFDLAIAIIIATTIGLATAWYAVDRGLVFGTVTVGSWKAWPMEGSANADPYSLAMLARSGEVPLGGGEGIAFTAETDRDGRLLDGRCTYAVDGQTPPARLWTLTAYDAAGRLMPNPAKRTGFLSREILRRPDGSFLITVTGEVTPGNWLPIAPVERFRLVFRLYDTPLTTGSQLAGVTMPAIIASRCP